MQAYKATPDERLEFGIACFYKDGPPDVKNAQEAAKWFQKVADRGGEKSDEAKRFLSEINKELKIYNAVNEVGNLINKYKEMVKDATPNPTTGPSKETVLAYMWGFCKACEVQSNDKSFTLQRGNTLRSTGFKGIPIGVELHPIRMSGSQLQMTYYFYQDEFGDWKGVEK